jgi:putative spermidine/putrescine transport system permease protein
MSDAVVITETKTLPFSFTLPVVAAAGAFFGLFVGTAQGSTLLGIVGGAVICAALAYVALAMAGVDQERTFKWAVIALFIVAGFVVGRIAGAVVGGLFGWFLGWFIYWIGRGRYRMFLPPYLT